MTLPDWPVKTVFFNFLASGLIWAGSLSFQGAMITPFV